ncbi:type III-A CRISPR-associated protein Csm2 [Desulfobacterium sp. N47]|uniref:CRISPR system Cms protein Csm2 n=1 Tax=uncultured Desulfobacterium sp. TaxID=201089 RepID=E1YM92_9BACT|nr:hypothetical protein N47_E47370 [uncultured Desulfobacterium sp.]
MDEIIQAIKAKTSFKEVSITAFAPSDQWSDQIAKKLGDKMKTTQLRKFFTSIKLMEQKTKGKDKTEIFNDTSLYMLLPYLAYAQARKLVTLEFYKLVKVIIGDGTNGKIKTVEDFQRFVEFMTAIVAYHKQYSK